MSIKPGESIGLEAHPDTDQFLRLDAGVGKCVMGPTEDNLNFEQEARTVGPSRSPPELGMTSSTRAMSRYSSTPSTHPSTTLLESSTKLMKMRSVTRTWASTFPLSGPSSPTTGKTISTPKARLGGRSSSGG